jgi:hypothetical protein
MQGAYIAPSRGARILAPMIRSTMTRGLLVAAAMLLASTATAQAPNANPHGKGNAADPASHAGAPGAKGEDKPKADDKAKPGEKKDTDKTAERAARKGKEHDAQKAKLSALLKAPADEAMKQELRRHAERVARLERIKSVATDAKDTDAGERATKLLVKENTRHDKWMEKSTASAGTGVPTTAPAAQPATKEGAK